MNRFLLVLVAVVSMAFQEARLPPGHYCMHGEPDNPRGHQCKCQMTCHVNEDGSVVVSESHDCKSYCFKDQCVCHTDEPCEAGRR